MFLYQSKSQTILLLICNCEHNYTDRNLKLQTFIFYNQYFGGKKLYALVQSESM